MAAVVESTGTRRAVVLSERYMEWHRELNSSRALHGGRRRHEDPDMETDVFKGNFFKSEENGEKRQDEQNSADREAEGEEPAARLPNGSASGTTCRVRRKKQLPQRQRSEVKKLRKENDVDDNETAYMPSKQKSSPPGEEGDGSRMRRCKQPIAQSVQALHPKRHVQPSTTAQQPPNSCLSQPIMKQKQRQEPRSASPEKVDKDIERVLRSLTRTRGCETPPPAPAVPAGKGTKRSKRVALRLANEEPPPAPLKLPKLQLVLTRKEIQEDWFKITGQKYSGKPKKSTIVQRGLGLCNSLTCPSSIRYLNEPQ